MIEFPMVIGLLLIPFGVLALSVSTWVERQTAARDAAAEAARHLVVSVGDGDGAASANEIVRQIERGYGLDEGVLRPVIPVGGFLAGQSVTVDVTVEVPALTVPIFGDVGSVDWTATHTERFPDYGATG